MNVNMNNPTVYRTTLFRSNTVAIILGVICPPCDLNCHQQRAKRNTTNESVDVMMASQQRPGTRHRKSCECPFEMTIEPVQYPRRDHSTGMAINGRPKVKILDSSSGVSIVFGALTPHAKYFTT